MTDWKKDIPLLDEGTQLRSERAVHLALVQQAQIRKEEQERWRKVLSAPELRPKGARNLVATRTGLLIGGAYVPPPQSSRALYGPFRRPLIGPRLEKGLGYVLAAVLGVGLAALLFFWWSA